MRVLLLLLLGLVAWTQGGCGYHLQTSRNPLFEAQGLRTVHVARVANDTFRPGAENVVYNAVLKRIAAGRKLQLVHSVEEADAVLTTRVVTAESVPAGGAETWRESLGPAPGKIAVTTGGKIATAYFAQVVCNFELKRTHPESAKKALVWGGQIARGKPYSSAVQLDVPGTTTALINASELDRAIGDLATQIADDMHQAMLDLF